MSMTRIWTITRLTKDDEQHFDTFLECTTDTYEQAKTLLEDVYNDCKEGFESKTGAKYSNPKWLDKNILQVDCHLRAGYSILHTVDTFKIGWTWKEKMHNPKWIME